VARRSRSWFQHVVVRVPRRGAILRATLRAGRPADLCSVSDDGTVVAAVALTAAGRDVFTDFGFASPFFDNIGLAAKGATTYAPAATLAARDPERLVALPGPEAFPPAGRRLGIWTSGDRAVMSVTSTTGHRFAMADEGNGVLRSNVDWLLFESVLLS
jgi:hypothetical protein